MATTSSVLTLAGGGSVRIDLALEGDPGKLTFTLLDASGQSLGGSVLVQNIFAHDPFGDSPFQIDGLTARALDNGGFVLTYIDRFDSFPIGQPPGLIQGLTSITYNASGILQGISGTFIDVPANASATAFNLQDFGLSDARHALLYDNLSAAAPGAHLAILGLQGPITADIPLPGLPTSAVQTGAALGLTFAGGAQVMVAAAAHSDVVGGAGDDTLLGGAWQDVLRGGDGNDSMLGGAGFDDINGNKGDDTIDGGAGGGDWLVGGQGNDMIVAHTGFNIEYGNLGNDTVLGGSGNDWLRGGQGDDSIVGGAGDNWISGDRGNDTEMGGAGADTFNGFAGVGQDRVLDFHASEGDRIQLDPGTHYSVSQVGADTVIDLGNGDQMTLVGVSSANLPPGWIFGA